MEDDGVQPSIGESARARVSIAVPWGSWDLARDAAIAWLTSGLRTLQEAREALLALPPAEAHRVLREYMMAATAKDCSVMITLRRLSDADAQPSADALGTLTVDTQHFEYKVLLCSQSATRAVVPYCELAQRIRATAARCCRPVDCKQ